MKRKQNMNEGLTWLIFCIIGFHIASYLGKREAEEESKKKEQHLKTQLDVQKKRYDDELRELKAKNTIQEQKIRTLQRKLEDCQEQLKATKAENANTSKAQVELEEYIKSNSKSLWQVGRDYELFVGQKYLAKGYKVDFYGIQKGFEDKGIDIIAKNDRNTLLIQCKYWKQGKVLHENVVHQLYGSATAYCREHNIPNDKIKPLLVTNVTLTEEAKDVSTFLGVKLVQRFAMEDFPRIKCCILKDEHGNIQKIYRLPFDESYDEIMPLQPGEHFVKTVQEAEDLGFERAK